MYMRYILCLLIYFFFLAETQAQRSFFNTAAFWSLFRYDTATPPSLSQYDTAIVVASSRVVRSDDSLRFVGEVRDCSNLRYYFVYAKDGTWHVFPAKSLAAALKYIPEKNRDWVVYADGFGKIFTSGVDRGMRMAAQHRLNVLYFDYPSYNSSKKIPGNYRFALSNARCACNDFVPVLDSVLQLRQAGEMGSGRLTLFFHSMGNNILREIVRKGRLPEISNSVWVDNLILNAPCVPQRHHKQWLDQIHFAQHIYVHYNPKDHVLAGAHLISLTRQLGEKLHRPLSSRAMYINFNTIAGKNHSNFLVLLQHPVPPQAALDYYYVLLHGNAVEISDTTFFRPSVYKSIGADLVR